MGLLNNAIPFSLIAWGEIRIASGLAAILNASTAILGALVAAAVFRDERLTPRKATGVTLGFLGVATVIGLDALEGFDLTSLSQLAVLGAACSYALSAAFARHALKGLAPQVAAAGMLTGSSVLMLPTMLLADGLPSLSYTPEVWAGLAYLAFAATAMAYLLYYRVLGMAGAGNVTLVTLLVAPIAILLGALVLGENLHPNSYLGFALLAAGLLVIDGRILRRRRRRPGPAEAQESA
jgi:drug/metabolite transporter (DMT)-like permease